MWCFTERRVKRFASKRPNSNFFHDNIKCVAIFVTGTGKKNL